MKKIIILSGLFLFAVMWTGCRGTGFLLMPSAEDIVNKKYRRSPAYMCGQWRGNYDNSRIEINAGMLDPQSEYIDVTMLIQDKDKKQPLIPAKVVAFTVGKNNYALLMADTGKLLEQGNYHPMSGGLLYPVMKIFQIQARDADTLAVFEVIFTKKMGKDKVVKLDPAMKMWGSNNNTLYGTSTELLSFLEKGAFQLSKEIVFEKIEAVQK